MDLKNRKLLTNLEKFKQGKLSSDNLLHSLNFCSLKSETEKDKA